MLTDWNSVLVCGRWRNRAKTNNDRVEEVDERKMAAVFHAVDHEGGACRILVSLSPKHKYFFSLINFLFSYLFYFILFYFILFYFILFYFIFFFFFGGGGGWDSP